MQFREWLRSRADCRIGTISAGPCVILEFETGQRVVYKPKDLRVDAVWAALVDSLNEAAPPVDLRAVRVLAREGYGWTEFIEHTKCARATDFALFFRRAGAWLALFHVFAALDMHQENILAAGSHPVPIDLEMILQAADPRVYGDLTDDTGQAYASAMQTVVNSVLTVGLLPAYGRHSTSKVFVIGGVNSNSSTRVTVSWTDVNTDLMSPVRRWTPSPRYPTCPTSTDSAAASVTTSTI